MSLRHLLLTVTAALALGAAVPAFAQDDPDPDGDELTQEELDEEIAEEEADEADWVADDDGDEGDGEEGSYEPAGPTEPRM